MRDLERYSSVRRWLDSVASSGIRSATTEKNYLIVLGQFCEFARKTPDELIEERREHLKSTDEMVRMQHEELLRRWQIFLESKRGLARGSVSTLFAIAKSFYSANYCKLTVKSPKSWATRVRKVPTLEELKIMVNSCNNAKDRAVIMFLAQTGMSLKDFLTQVTYGKIKDEFESGIEPLHISIVRTKTMVRYDTFLGQNGLDFLKQHLRVVGAKADEPLFRIASRRVEYIVSNASERAGLNPAVTPHKLRAFFSTRLKLSECPDELVEYWMGHTIPYGGAYFVPPPEEQRKIYKNYEWAISIR